MSCFVDTSLELFYRGLTTISEADRHEFARCVRYDDKSGLRDVFEHLWRRGTLTGGISSGKKPSKTNLATLDSALSIGQKKVMSLISGKWDLALESPGMPGCPRTWVNRMIMVCT